MELVFSTEKFDTSPPVGSDVLNICIVFAQLECETIQKHVTDAYYSGAWKIRYLWLSHTKHSYDVWLKCRKKLMINMTFQHKVASRKIYDSLGKSNAALRICFESNPVQNSLGYFRCTKRMEGLSRMW